ncbi:unnamed protein product [Cunninghamella blakesleeana]
MVDEEINKIKTSPTLQQHVANFTFGGYTIKSKPTRSVYMRIAIPNLYSQLIYTLQQRLSKELNIESDQPLPNHFAPNFNLTSTSIERMLLAYNVLSSISEENAIIIKNMANDLINVNKWVNGKELSWEIVLYEILLESQVIGETTQLSKIKSWSLDMDNSNENDQSHLALIPYSKNNLQQQFQQPQPQPQRTGFFSSWIPTSLRVKLSVLSTRFR